MKSAQPITSGEFRELGSTFSAFLELTKPRIVSMVMVTTAVGYLLGSRGEVNLGVFFSLLLWSSCSCAGVGVLNQYLEKEEDSLMIRTSSRPLPLNRINPRIALSLGLFLAILGSASLFVLVNEACGLLSILTTVLYVLVYTPLKKISWWNTVVGAIPGALPPLGGWVAGSGRIEVGGVILFLILFFWQHPHFYSIAWMYKDDYERGGFQMLPSVDPTGRRMFFQIFFFLSLLTFASMLPVLFARVSVAYVLIAMLLSVVFWRAGLKFYSEMSRENALGLLKASIVYLPSLLAIMILQVQF